MQAEKRIWTSITAENSDLGEVVFFGPAAELSVQESDSSPQEVGRMCKSEVSVFSPLPERRVRIGLEIFSRSTLLA